MKWLNEFSNQAARRRFAARRSASDIRLPVLRGCSVMRSPSAVVPGGVQPRINPHTAAICKQSSQ